MWCFTPLYDLPYTLITSCVNELENNTIHCVNNCIQKLSQLKVACTLFSARNTNTLLLEMLKTFLIVEFNILATNGLIMKCALFECRCRVVVIKPACKGSEWIHEYKVKYWHLKGQCNRSTPVCIGNLPVRAQHWTVYLSNAVSHANESCILMHSK